jgi:hypothetical protein
MALPDRKMGGREGLNVDLADTNPCPSGPPASRRESHVARLRC